LFLPINEQGEYYFDNVLCLISKHYTLGWLYLPLQSVYVVSPQLDVELSVDSHSEYPD